MTEKGILIMKQQELKKLQIVHKVIDKRITQKEAARLLGLSDRQIRRIEWRIKEEGDKGIIHRGRGQPSHRAIPVRLKDRIVKLCREKYVGFNPTFASEKLFEINKIRISKEALRLLFIVDGIAYDTRKARPHCQWRERKHYYGEMLQMDGSHHDWFEGRAPSCVLMGYIDDATSAVFAQFYEYEGTFPAMDSFKRYITRYGLPQSVYLDRHSTYKSTAKASIADELSNREPLSQFGRALEELEVNLIHAASAPAKGRIERLFKTFQDRLIKEMRLRGIKTIKAANKFLLKYLPVFNRRFNVEPTGQDDLHRLLPKGIDLEKILSIKTPRALRNDFTVMHKGKLYQIEDNIRTKEVTVEERLDGSLVIVHKGINLRYKEINIRPKKEEKTKTVIHKTYIPPQDHPWRGFKLPGSLSFKEKPEEALAGVL